MKIKWIILATVVLVIPVVLFKQLSTDINLNTRPTTLSPAVTKQTITISQNITTDGNTIKASNDLSVEKGTTALNLLKKTTTVQTNGEGVNAFVTEINDRKADESKREFWAFYVNGKQAEVGAGSYVLKEHDKIEWKIETY